MEPILARFEIGQGMVGRFDHTTLVEATESIQAYVHTFIGDAL